jgi:endonuclease I
LLRWHAEDPVSEQELQRNERIFRLQGNRNPFIDHPDLASAIYRGDLR